MPYYALIRQARQRSPSPDEVQAMMADNPDLTEEVAATMSILSFDWTWEGPFGKYKPAFRRVTPLMHELVPDAHNAGYVTNRDPQRLPLDRILTPGNKALNKHVLRQFHYPQPLVDFLRRVEDAVAVGAEPPGRPDGIHQRPYDLAVQRGQDRHAAGAPERADRRIALPDGVSALTYNVLRKAAKALGVSSLGRAEAIRSRVVDAIAQRRLGVEIDGSLDAPELRGG